MLADDSAVMTKTKELCAAIAEDGEYKALLETVETFLNDDAAKSQYQSVHQRGEELQQKRLDLQTQIKLAALLGRMALKKCKKQGNENRILREVNNKRSWKFERSYEAFSLILTVN